MQLSIFVQSGRARRPDRGLDRLGIGLQPVLTALAAPRRAWHRACDLDGVSQPFVEQVLGRMVTDETFRTLFRRDAEATCRASGYQLSRKEIDALLQVPPNALAALAKLLDDRVCRFVPLPEPGAEALHTATSSSAPPPAADFARARAS